jgi:uncharacterized protein
MTAPANQSPLASTHSDSRLRAYGQFLIALFYFFLVGPLAHHAARRIATDQWSPLVEQAVLAFLLVFGYAGFGFTLNRRQHPIADQGLPARPGWLREIALGLSIGWGMAVVCAIAMALFGGIVISLSFSLVDWGWFLADAVWFALAALAVEVAFRGYAFQRFARATGSAGAVFGFSLLYGFLESMRPGATHTSAAVAFVLAVLLSTAYLRTRALWVGWGVNFGWQASRALLFGLTVRGDSSNSPIVQGDPTGPFWLTGGGYGLDASWFAFLVILLALPVLYRVTRDLDFRYNAPELAPAGIPVDLEAAARRQHEAVMGSAEPAPPGLIQIAGVDAPRTQTEPTPVPEPASEFPHPEAGNESP